MDIVLEACDYLLFDWAYAKVLPSSTKLPQIFQNNLKFDSLWSNSEASSLLNSNSTISQSTNLISQSLKYVGTKIMERQNQNEIYGSPKYFPASKFIDSSMLARDNLLREAFSMFAVTAIFGWVLYFVTAYLSYLFVFDRNIFNHPRYLKNQMSLEIKLASTSIPIMVLCTLPFFLLEIHGFSKLYMNVDESTGGWKSIILQVPSFILFTDCFIYLIHRWLHWPSVYKLLHKPHHKWIVCTPFASHAFHPFDGFMQSLPYHWFPFMFPLHKLSYLFLFTFVNFWTVMIHDGNYMSNDPVVNGTACHTVHHLYFNYNYGQFTTLWDRIGGSYRRPDDKFFVKEKTKADEKDEWKDQTEQMEAIRGKLEGKSDDRVYNE